MHKISRFGLIWTQLEFVLWDLFEPACKLELVVRWKSEAGRSLMKKKNHELNNFRKNGKVPVYLKVKEKLLLCYTFHDGT